MTVRVFKSTDVGAPVLSGTLGALIALLDACLINGYSTQSLTSISRVGSVATVIKAQHGYDKHNRITQGGWDQAEYNGDFRVESVVDVNTYTIQVTGTPTTPGTGTTPTAKKSGAGWTKPYTGANLASYMQPVALTNPVYFAVTDNSTLSSTVRGYENMTGVSTGTGDFPTVAQRATPVGVIKSSVADATARPWVLLVSEGTVWLWINSNNSADGSGGCIHGFGDFTSYKSGDAWNKFVMGNGWNGTAITAGYQYNFAGNLNATLNAAVITDHYIARSYTQGGGSIAFGKVSDYAKTAGQIGIGSTNGTAQLSYPHVVDSGLYLSNIWLHEAYATTSILRGEFPGLWNPLQYQPLANYDTFSGVGSLSGKDFLSLRGLSNASNGTYLCEYFLEVSDTW